MTVLSDRTIKERMAKDEIVVEPLGDNAIQPASVDAVSYTHLTLPTILLV